MKKILLFSLLLFFIGRANGQDQKSYYASQTHASDVNITQITDGTDDVMVATNLFDSSVSTYELTLKRLNSSNSIVWSKTYSSSTLSNARVLDVYADDTYVYITGSVDQGGNKKALIAKINASNGIVQESKYYEIAGGVNHATGLKILATGSDATGDGFANDGLLITGFYSDCYTLNTTCGNNAGFVLRVDSNLDFIWVIDSESIVATGSWDYDFINGAVETSDGFVLTGSATGTNQAGFVRQSVLAYKIDFEGGFVWDSSYTFGNANDMSMDAYYDQITDEVYMLINYSNSHMFAVTVFENTTGNILTPKSWFAQGPSETDMNYYGFSILESLDDAGNLVIAGYSSSLYDGTVTNETNPFLYEFEKATGNQVGVSYLYNLNHQVATNDEYDFWNGQLPLVYYPDIALTREDNGVPQTFLLLGYLTNGDGYTEIELVEVNALKRNTCLSTSLSFQNQGLVYTSINSLSTATSTVTATPFVLNDSPVAFTVSSCGLPLGIDDVGFEKDVNLSVYPNPSKDVVHVQSEKTVFSVSVYDPTGRQVVSGQFNSNNITFNVSELSKGIYLLVLDYGDEAVKRKLLIE